MTTPREFLQSYSTIAGYVMNTRDIARHVLAFVGELPASTTASLANTSRINSSAYDSNFNCTIYCTTGDLWINTDTSATTDSFKLSTSMNPLNLRVEDYISTISDSTAAKYEYIIWESDTP